ncbi:MAG: T9SS type A sorting domain-containing protein [Saprospiraceae bacterium]|nr:T9SS type A sorting domain-containing protein [Saprospiraceae bacterium]
MNLGSSLLMSVIIFFSFSTMYAQVISVGQGGDFATLAAAESSISAGDTVIILDGTFSQGAQFLADLNGSAISPIIIKAEHSHQAIFRGGTEAIHLVNCSYLEIQGIVVEQQTGNGINIDDGGDYSSPTHHITISSCIFRDMQAAGNNDLLKLSGLDSFNIRNCQFINGGGGGSGIDMVGCHWGVIEDCQFEDSGTSGIQAKGGTQHILMQRNVFKNINQRAINLGGSTGLQFFRPPLPNPIVNAFEAADLQVYGNIFIGSWSPIAYVGSMRVKVVNNTFYEPENWVVRILQETTEPGFVACGNNEFRNNVVYLENDLTEVNIGPNTDAESFIFTNNLWFNEQSSTWGPALPVTDSNQIIGDPLFVDATNENFSIPSNSPCVQNGKTLSEPRSDFAKFLYFAPPSIGAYEGHESTTAVPYLIAPSSISMGPNPTLDRVTIDGDFSNADIKILDVQGQLVSDFSNASAPLIIQLDELPNGLYFISIKNRQNPALWIERILKCD